MFTTSPDPPEVVLCSGQDIRRENLVKQPKKTAFLAEISPQRFTTLQTPVFLGRGNSGKVFFDSDVQGGVLREVESCLLTAGMPRTCLGRGLSEIEKSSPNQAVSNCVTQFLLKAIGPFGRLHRP